MLNHFDRRREWVDHSLPLPPPLTEDLKGGEEGDGSIYIGFFPYTVYTIEEPYWIFIIYDKIFELIFIQILSIVIHSHPYLSIFIHFHLNLSTYLSKYI